MKPITKQTVKTASKFVAIGLLIGLLIGAFIAYGQSPTSTFTISSGVYPGAPSYTIWNEGSEYFAKDANGLLAFSGTNASQISQSCVYALDNNGGTIHYSVGIYVFDSPVYIDVENLLVEGEGEPQGGAGYALDTKYGTNIILDSVDGFIIGSVGTPVPHANVRGITIRNIAFYGFASEVGLAAGDYTTGAAIYVQAGTVLEFENLYVARKEYGIRFATRASYVTDWVIIKNCLFDFNVYGIYHDSGWLALVHIQDVHGYLNQRSLIYVSTQYSLSIQDITSEADSWNVPLGSGYAPLALIPHSDTYLQRISIEADWQEIVGVNNHATNACALVYITMAENAVVWLSDFTLQGCVQSGLKIWGTTNVRAYISNFVIGFHGGSNWRGGPEAIGYYGIYASLTGAEISNGYINSTLAPIYNTGSVHITNVNSTVGFIGIKYGNTSIADGATINHGLAGIPQRVIVTTSVANEFASVTAKDGTAFTVAIKKHDGSTGTTQTIYWQADYQP